MTSKRRKKNKPEQIVAKLRDADAMLNAGKDLAAVLQALRSARRRCTAGERMLQLARARLSKDWRTARPRRMASGAVPRVPPLAARGAESAAKEAKKASSGRGC